MHHVEVVNDIKKQIVLESLGKHLTYTDMHTANKTSAVQPALPHYAAASLNHTSSLPPQGFGYHLPSVHMALLLIFLVLI